MCLNKDNVGVNVATFNDPNVTLIRYTVPFAKNQLHLAHLLTLKTEIIRPNSLNYSLKTDSITMLKRHVLLIALVCSTVQIAFGQPSTTPQGMETPDWVVLMDDPSANYFTALESYNAYWKSHLKPGDEEEEMGNPVSSKGKSARELRREEREREREESHKKKLSGSELEQTEYLKYQCKRFENWALEVKPWVQEDGHILSYEERTAIWKKQQEERQQQENKK